MGAKKTVTVSTTDEIKVVKIDQKPKSEDSKTADDKKSDQASVPAKIKKSKKAHSKKYQTVRSKIDRTKTYDPFAAVELVKKLSYTKFSGTITAHIKVKDQGISQDVALPHSTGQTKKIEIASDKTLEKIEAGNLDFDILLTTPQFMAKLTKFAPILGPKGLMPNPKNGTLTANPEEKAKELESGRITIRTEKKAPLIHITIGKTDMDTKQLTENLQALIKALNTKLVKVTIAATMSPGVKVEIGDV